MPLGGIAKKLTVLCNESGEYVTYRSDEHGFHNPAGIWNSRQVEVAAIGDSFTHGSCVPSDENFVALIRQHHPATLNLAMAGSGPLVELAALSEYLPPLAAKIVLWFYFEDNDLWDLEGEKTDPLLMHYLKSGFKQDLITQQKKIDQALMDYVARETARSKKLNMDLSEFLDVVNLHILRQKLGLMYGIETHDSDRAADLKGPTMNLFRDILSRANERVSAWGGGFYFVYLPAGGRRYANLIGIGEKQRSQVLTIVSSLGIPVIDLLPVFQAQNDVLSLYPFRRPVGHYNEKGHQLVAEEVLKALPSDQTLDNK